MPVPQARGAEAAENPPASTEEERALDRARDSGTRTEVESRRTEYATVYANPDGATFTLEQSVVPVRVAKAAGGWQAPTRRSNAAPTERSGRRPPRSRSPCRAAVTTPSRGSRSPDVRCASPGREKPHARIDGASAVYADVLPDVDLKVTATVESFQQVLVVRTPEAAADPRLKKLTLGMETSGLDVRKGGSGNLAAVDGDGQTVFRSPPAQMWDSAGAAAPASAPRRATGATAPRSPVTSADPATGASAKSGAPASPAPEKPADPAESSPSGQGAEPGQGDNVERVDVQVTEDSLTLVPDAGMLKGTPPGRLPALHRPARHLGRFGADPAEVGRLRVLRLGQRRRQPGQGRRQVRHLGGLLLRPGLHAAALLRVLTRRAQGQERPARRLPGDRALGVPVRSPGGRPGAHEQHLVLHDLVLAPRQPGPDGRPERLRRPRLRVRPGLAGRPITFEDSPSESNENLTPTVKSFAAGKFSGSP
ncbi:hypothetical protein STENM327S_02329 [Streptomyces tendae]